jgi:hypothetical protein
MSYPNPNLVVLTFGQNTTPIFIVSQESSVEEPCLTQHSTPALGQQIHQVSSLVITVPLVQEF